MFVALAFPGNVNVGWFQDGSLRRKEVLNDGGDSVRLFDERSREIATLVVPGGESDE